MGRIFSAGMDIGASLVFLLPAFAVCHLLIFHKREHTALYLVFAFYLIAIMSLVGIPNVNYIRFDLNINLIPFADLVYDWKNALLNVLLFAPMGVFLPILWERYRRFQNTALLCLCLSGIIEGLQIFTFRATDVNDLMTNTLGGILGFFLARIMTKGFSQYVLSGTKRSEMYLVFAISFAVMFFGVPIVPLIW